MHASATVDCVMQLSGESVFLLEDNEIHLKPGDWLVINGVVHSWRNDGDEPAVLIAVMVGADHLGIPKR
ncbi:cupin domain-containing protein [Nocardia sp. NPDC051030]|uniref:cupin domain-containing protein n=1 Tax=Nocardia sp. NPDC051030 TaxID=3155162 RepID=UPI00341D6E7E